MSAPGLPLLSGRPDMQATHAPVKAHLEIIVRYDLRSVALGFAAALVAWLHELGSGLPACGPG